MRYSLDFKKSSTILKKSSYYQKYGHFQLKCKILTRSQALKIWGGFHCKFGRVTSEEENFSKGKNWSG